MRVDAEADFLTFSSAFITTSYTPGTSILRAMTGLRLIISATWLQSEHSPCLSSDSPSSEADLISAHSSRQRECDSFVKSMS